MGTSGVGGVIHRGVRGPLGPAIVGPWTRPDASSPVTQQPYLPAMVRLVRAAMGNIRQNVTLALGLKAVFLVTSVLGITGLWIAILADTGATVLVTLNALRLLRFNPERES